MNELEVLPPLQQQIVHALLPFAKALFPYLQRDSMFHWWLILSTLLFGVLGWMWFERKPAQGLREFFRVHFSSALWWHQSSRADYAYYFVNAGFFALLFAPLLLSAAVLSEHLHQGLRGVFGDGPQWDSGTGTRVAYTVLLFVVYDFGRWAAHTLLHEVPLLWQFHKVHHSAEVLTPFTAYRVHPLDLLLTHSIPVLTTTPVTAAFLYLFPDAVNAYTFLGAHFLLGFSGLLANLKHWQVWITYGPLNRWLISPAHHQIHHSAEARHFGKNRGFEIALWDRLYGSLYVPPREKLQFKMGLGDGSDGQWHSLRALYLRPFRLALQKLRGKEIGAALLLILCLTGFQKPVYAADPGKKTVYMEELTWPELAARIAAGADTVLVPIGGTEQNGPQMTLGKHNAIVHFAAGQIARRHGQALVAPVLPLAPEGGIDPRSGNMQWPGTMHLREATLAAVLEDSIASLALCGFRNIVLIGDHGGSQSVQARLAQEKSTPKLRVIHLSRYYEPAPLAERAQRLKLPAESVGNHAGIVDTAELLAIKPEWVRQDQLTPKSWSGFATPPGSGASGRPDQASAKLGRQLLEQKIEAGLAQLKAKN